MKISFNKNNGKVMLTSNAISNQLIGEVKNNVFFCKRKREHIYKKLGSIGINKKLLGLPSDTYKIQMSHGIVFMISKPKIFEFMKSFDSYLHFTDETQVHIPLAICDEYNFSGDKLSNGISVVEFASGCSKLWKERQK